MSKYRMNINFLQPVIWIFNRKVADCMLLLHSENTLMPLSYVLVTSQNLMRSPNNHPKIRTSFVCGPTQHNRLLYATQYFSNQISSAEMRDTKSNYYANKFIIVREMCMAHVQHDRIIVNIIIAEPPATAADTSSISYEYALSPCCLWLCII